MTFNYKNLLLGTAAGALVLGAPLGSAIAEVDEIVVSAQKRDQTLQEVPIAVSAYSPDQLDKSGVSDIRSLMSLSPSLSVQSSNSESGGSTFRLRGVGTTGNNAGLEGAVGVFLDGVYLSRPGIAFQDFLDIEQIEVLRGPQGTLFGRNTSAGAISIRTKKPSFDGYQVSAALNAGNYDLLSVAGSANMPVSDQLAFRLSATSNQRAGYRESGFSGLESNNRDRYAVRGQALWAPSESFDLRIIADYMDATGENCCDAMILHERGDQFGVGSDGQLATLQIGAVPSDFFLTGGYVGGFAAEGDGITINGDSALDDRKTNANLVYENPQEQYGFSAEANWDLNGVDITYVGSYRDYDSTQNGEVDFTSLDILRIDNSTGGVETWSHELRFQGQVGRFDWLIGGYYSDETITSSQRLAPGSDYYQYSQSFVNATRASIAGAFGLLLPEFETMVDPLGGAPDGVSGVYASTPTINNFEQEGKSWSLFTHNVIGLTDRIDLTLGARYINEEKDAVFDQVDGTASAGCTNAAPTLRAARTGGGVFDSTGNATAAAVAGFYGPFPNGKDAIDELYEIWVAFACFPFLSGEVPEFDQSYEDDSFAGTASLSFAMTEDVNVYGSFSRGYKAGGFNLDPTAAVVTALDATTEGDASFDSEIVDAYEIGLKGLFFDRTVQTNVAIFHMDIEDIQVLEFNGVQFVVANVSEAVSTGAEVETVWTPMDGLTLNSAVTYADSRYPDEVRNDGVGSLGSKVAGRNLTNAPRWVLQAGATYEWMLASDLAAFVHADARYDSSRNTGTVPANQRFYFTSTDDEVDAGKKQDEAVKLNLRGGIGNAEGNWSVEVWGRNVTDETTSQIIFGIPLRGGALGAFTDDPATYGMTLRANF